MNNRRIFTIINLSGLVVALMLWVIALADEEALPGYNFAWVAFIVTAIWGVSFTVRAVIDKQAVLKKSWAILAGVFYLAAAGALIGALALSDKLVLPIICLAAAVAALVGSLVVSGKKWDEGDNQKPDYKNYHERKAEAKQPENQALDEEEK